MFYQCPKCKKTWQYPVEKCLDCLLELERLLAKEAKVIGISQTTIPTLLHPKSPYFVLILENENGHKWVQKSIKKYKIGDVVKYEPSQDKKAVAVWRIKYDILEAIEKVIELIGGLEINPKTKILILPTLSSPTHPYLAVNTHPQFLENLIRYLTRIGGEVKNIKVAAQSFNEVPVEAIAKKSQLLDVCLQNQVRPLDLAKGNFVKCEKNGLTFEISEEVFNNDLIINLPILKLDSKLGVRGASENSLKFLKKESYLSLQYLSSQEEIMEKLPQALPSYLTIADGFTIQKTTGLTIFLGLALASFSPLNLDRVFAETAMIGDLPVPLKRVKVEDIPIVGREVEELQYEVEKN